MAETKPGKNNLSIPTITTDANGWRVYDYGTHKQYRKKGAITESLTASQWKYSVNAVPLPAGFTTLGNTRFVEGTAIPGDSAMTVQIANTDGLTGINFSITNQWAGGSLNNINIYYSLCITTSD